MFEGKAGALAAAQQALASGVTSGVITQGGTSVAWGGAQLPDSGSQLGNTLQSGISNLANITSLGVVNELSSPVLDVIAPLTFAAPVHAAAIQTGAPAVGATYFPQIAGPARQAWETFSRASEMFSAPSGMQAAPRWDPFGAEYRTSLAAAIRAAQISAFRRGLGTSLRGLTYRGMAARGRTLPLRRARQMSFGGAIA
jgi:hypothetical protein